MLARTTLRIPGNNSTVKHRPLGLELELALRSFPTDNFVASLRRFSLLDWNTSAPRFASKGHGVNDVTQVEPHNERSARNNKIKHYAPASVLIIVPDVQLQDQKTRDLVFRASRSAPARLAVAADAGDPVTIERASAALVRIVVDQGRPRKQITRKFQIIPSRCEPVAAQQPSV